LEGKSLREGKDNSQILFVTSLLSLFFWKISHEIKHRFNVSFFSLVVQTLNYHVNLSKFTSYLWIQRALISSLQW
jgi:hypothetical protein